MYIAIIILTLLVLLAAYFDEGNGSSSTAPPKQPRSGSELSREEKDAMDMYMFLNTGDPSCLVNRDERPDL